jgi:DNA-directed RNA polymerase specialized sigma24 family protein
MHIDRLKQILDDWALWMHTPSHKLGYPSKSLGMISGGESTSDAFEEMLSEMDMTNVRTIDAIISSLPEDQKDAVYARYLKTSKYDDYETQLSLAFDNMLTIASRRIVA